MQLYRRGKVWWVRWYERGTKFRRSTKETNRSNAEIVRRKWEKQVADPFYSAANQATVASAAERFLEELASEGKAPGTVNMYECKAQHVVRLLGERHLRDLSHEHVLQFIRDRKKETAGSHTIHRELTTLRRILKSAARAREFDRALTTVLPKFAANYVPRTRWLTEDELWAAIAHLPPGHAAAVAFSVATASDRGSVFRARPEDVGETMVRVRGSKTTNRKREVPRVSLFAKLLTFALENADGESGLLFKPWGNMRRDVIAACKRAGIDPFTWNDLRRTAATWLVKRGIALNVASRFLGHASTAMLQKVYGQMDSADIGRLIEERTVPVAYPNRVETAHHTDTKPGKNKDGSR